MLFGKLIRRTVLPKQLLEHLTKKLPGISPNICSEDKENLPFGYAFPFFVASSQRFKSWRQLFAHVCTALVRFSCWVF